jgi:hypothetical protein
MMIDINNITLACFHGIIIVCVLGSKQGPPTTTPLHTGIVTLAVVVQFAVLWLQSSSWVL